MGDVSASSADTVEEYATVVNIAHNRLWGPRGNGFVARHSGLGRRREEFLSRALTAGDDDSRKPKAVDRSWKGGDGTGEWEGGGGGRCLMDQEDPIGRQQRCRANVYFFGFSKCGECFVVSLYFLASNVCNFFRWEAYPNRLSTETLALFLRGRTFWRVADVAVAIIL